MNFSSCFYLISFLIQNILGTGLNKTRRNSNWEQRPLTQFQVCVLNVVHFIVSQLKGSASMWNSFPRVFISSMGIAV